MYQISRKSVQLEQSSSMRTDITKQQSFVAILRTRLTLQRYHGVYVIPVIFDSRFF